MCFKIRILQLIHTSRTSQMSSKKRTVSLDQSPGCAIEPPTKLAKWFDHRNPTVYTEGTGTGVPYSSKPDEMMESETDRDTDKDKDKDKGKDTGKKDEGKKNDSSKTPPEQPKIIFFMPINTMPPLPPKSSGGDSPNPDTPYPPFDDEIDLTDESECDKSDCDHEEPRYDEDFSPKAKELHAIERIKDINDLIHLGKLYHCRKRTTYRDIDLYTLHKLRKPLGKLNRLIGLQKIKENIVNQIVYFLSGLQSGNDDMMHTVIEGPPGSGKTEVGRILGEVYRSMGLLESNVFRIVKRSELIGKYLGHTSQIAPKM